jgi:hypothetical protein
VLVALLMQASGTDASAPDFAVARLAADGSWSADDPARVLLVALVPRTMAADPELLRACLLQDWLATAE